MAQIIDGTAQAAIIKNQVKEHLDSLEFSKIERPTLAVVQVGNDPASTVYIGQKEKACAQVGFGFKRVGLPADISQDKMIAEIEALNNDPAISGFIVQQPLPEHLDPDEILAKVAPNKDVDCLNPYNIGLMTDGRGVLLPCTPAGVMALLDAYNIDLQGKHCVVVGASRIVGRPMGLMLLAKNATVTYCHIYTQNLAEITRQADVLVVAVGKINLITADMIKPGSVLIDIGINRLSDKKICGDIDYDGCFEKASHITPVPGGVGPMTVAILMANCLTAWENQKK